VAFQWAMAHNLQLQEQRVYATKKFLRRSLLVANLQLFDCDSRSVKCAMLYPECLSFANDLAAFNLRGGNDW